MPKKTLSVAGKTVTLTQLIVAGMLCVFALAGGFFGILQAEDRWNQGLRVIQLEDDMLAGFKQMYQQQNIRFEEQRIDTLYDQLVNVKAKLAADPNNSSLIEQVRYLQIEINKARARLQKLHDGERID